MSYPHAYLLFISSKEDTVWVISGYVVQRVDSATYVTDWVQDTYGEDQQVHIIYEDLPNNDYNTLFRNVEGWYFSTRIYRKLNRIHDMFTIIRPAAALLCIDKAYSNMNTIYI